MGRTKKKRGNRTHGRGKKAGRGKGKRGGHGQAGLLKHKWKWTVKYDPDHFGRHGFTRPPVLQGEVRTINLEDLVRNLDALEEAGFAEKAADGYKVDLAAAGFDKLLGRGRADVPLTVTVEAASAGAMAKVTEAGGEVVLTSAEGEA